MTAGAVSAWSGVIAVAMLGAAAPGSFTPARYLGGAPSVIPIQSNTGGEVFVEATVNTAGLVIDVRPLRTTPPFTDAVVSAVRDWTFTPAIEGANPGTPPRPASTKVFVAAIFRPPILIGTALGASAQDVASPSAEAAAPVSTAMPGTFPPNALLDGTVLLECHIGPAGQLLGTKVLQSSPPFDPLALDAITHWTFRPARRDGEPIDAYAYVSFAFRQPVI